MVVEHLTFTIISGIVTIVLALAIYRKRAVAAWGWIASFGPDLPVFLLAPLGATNLTTVLLVTHTLGLFLFPLILVIADILLLELWLLRKISFSPYPKAMRTVKRVDRFMHSLEKYNAIPRPVRIKRVYLIGLVAGGVHVVVNLLAGSI